MLELSSETVRRLIALAREIQSQESVPMPEEAGRRAVDLDALVPSAQGGDLSSAEFRSIVEDLEPDQQQQVVALMWLGRGDFEAEEWAEAVELAEERWSEETADYLLSHPMLADELEAGLLALGGDLED